MVEYRLFALKTDEDGYKAIEHEALTRIEGGHILVYTTVQPPCEALEITDENVSLLSGNEMKWLQECNALILQQYAADNEAELAETMNDFIDRFSAELAKERDTIAPVPVEHKAKEKKPWLERLKDKLRKG